MFAFRKKKTRPKVHNSAAKYASTTKRRGNQVNRSHNPPPQTRVSDACDNSSVDMSLYTTQSKSTVRYPPRGLVPLHYFDDDDSYDIMDAEDDPTEYTTEVMLKRYSRLGGSQTPANELKTPQQCAGQGSRSTPSPLTPSTLPLTPVDVDSPLEDQGFLQAAKSSAPAEGSRLRGFREDSPPHHFGTQRATEASRDPTRHRSLDPTSDEVLNTSNNRSRVTDSVDHSTSHNSSTSLSVSRISTRSVSRSGPVDLDDEVVPDSPVSLTAPASASLREAHALDTSQASSRSRSMQYSGPVDLDDYVSDSSSESSCEDEPQIKAIIGLVSEGSGSDEGRIGVGSDGSREAAPLQNRSRTVQSVGRHSRSDTTYSRPEVSGKVFKDDDTYGFSLKSRLSEPSMPPQVFRDDDTYGFSSKSRLSGASTPHQIYRDDDTYGFSQRSGISRGSMPHQVYHDDDTNRVSLQSRLSEPSKEADDDVYAFSVCSPPPLSPKGNKGSFASPPMSPALILRDDDSEEVVWTDNSDDDLDVGAEKQHTSTAVDTSACSNHRSIDSTSISKPEQPRRVSKFEPSVSPSFLMEDLEEFDDTNTHGAVLLTSDELNKHLSKVQNSTPLPTSSIEGYDSWRLKQEYQRRYFAKLQKIAGDRRRRSDVVDKRQPTQARRSNPRIEQRQQHDRQRVINESPNGKRCSAVDSTRSAMDASMDSSIPTLDDGTPKPRRQKKQETVDSSQGRRRWGLWFHSKKDKKRDLQRTSKQHVTPTKTKTAAATKPLPGPAVLPLDDFMAVSADEPSVVADFSLSPLNKAGPLTLGSTTLPADTLAATKSHYLESLDLGPRQLARQYLEEERQKQRVAEMDKIVDEKMEAERINRLKQRELERQRLLNLPTQRSLQHPYSHGLKQFPAERPFRTDQIGKERERVAHDSILEKKRSICSKTSVNSSMQSGSSSILAPCVLCNDTERSHIAMPCMHFSFCESCVAELYQSECTVCPVCSTENVAFTRVHTG